MRRPSLPPQFQLLLIIAAFFSCNQVLFANEPNESFFIWGPEVNGLSASVEFIPDKEIYTQGEIIGISFCIRNVSTHRIQFVTSDWRNDDSCIIEDANGNKIQCSGIMYLGYQRMARIVLDPCESTIIKSSSFGIAQNNSQQFNHPVGNYIHLEPGRYLLCYHLRFPDIISTALPTEPNDWIGTLETGKRVLLVIVERREPNSPAKQ
jgi:hypothetical protein